MVVERWCDLALRESWSVYPSWIEAVGRLARKSGDRRRDVGDILRERIATRLRSMSEAPGAHAALEAITVGGVPSVRTRFEHDGDDVPLGLILEGSREEP